MRWRRRLIWPLLWFMLPAFLAPWAVVVFGAALTVWALIYLRVLQAQPVVAAGLSLAATQALFAVGWLCLESAGHPRQTL